jgi:hypothetical protein
MVFDIKMKIFVKKLLLMVELQVYTPTNSP